MIADIKKYLSFLKYLPTYNHLYYTVTYFSFNSNKVSIPFDTAIDFKNLL